MKAKVKNNKKKSSHSRNNNKNSGNNESSLIRLDQLTLIAAILGLIVSAISLYVAYKQLSIPAENEAEDIILR